MWTAIATCKKQNRSLFSFLKDSIAAKLEGQKAPSLLPAEYRDRLHDHGPRVVIEEEQEQE